MPSSDGKRQRGHPVGVRRLREQVAEQVRHVILGRRRRKQLRRQAAAQLLEECAGVGQPRFAQQGNGAQFAQCAAHQLRHGDTAIGMAFQHLKEEAEARGRRGGAFGIRPAPRANPRQELLDPCDAVHERRGGIGTGHQPVDADRRTFGRRGHAFVGPKPPPPGVSITNTSPACISTAHVAPNSSRVPSPRARPSCGRRAPGAPPAMPNGGTRRWLARIDRGHRLRGSARDARRRRRRDGGPRRRCRAGSRTSRAAPESATRAPPDR